MKWLCLYIATSRRAGRGQSHLYMHGSIYCNKCFRCQKRQIEMKSKTLPQQTCINMLQERMQTQPCAHVVAASTAVVAVVETLVFRCPVGCSHYHDLIVRRSYCGRDDPYGDFSHRFCMHSSSPESATLCISFVWRSMAIPPPARVHQTVVLTPYVWLSRGGTTSWERIDGATRNERNVRSRTSSQKSERSFSFPPITTYHVYNGKTGQDYLNFFGRILVLLEVKKLSNKTVVAFIRESTGALLGPRTLIQPHIFSLFIRSLFLLLCACYLRKLGNLYSSLRCHVKLLSRLPTVISIFSFTPNF